MFILNQDRTELVNLDNVSLISKQEIPEENKIDYVCYTLDDMKIHLGEYEDTPEHENQLEKIVERAGATNVYYMPEEERYE